MGRGKTGGGLGNLAFFVFFHKRQPHVFGHKTLDVRSVAGRRLDDGGTDEQPLVVGHEKDRLDMALQAAVHEGQLELVFKVRDGAQPAQQNTGPALGGILYREVSTAQDKTAWIGTFYAQQKALVDSLYFEGLYIQDMKNDKVYIYDSIKGTEEMFTRFLYQLKNNQAIHTHELREFLNNSTSLSLYSVYQNNVDVKTQLTGLQSILDQILESYALQSGSFKLMNLSRMLPLFEMYAILVNRSIKGSLNGEK